jgi:SPP1 family predicted phage head-tail adaptor
MGQVNAGRLNQRITIEKKSTVRDDWGQEVEGWVPVHSRLPASIKTINGTGFVNQEFVAGDKEVSRATASFRIRYIEPVDAAMRVVHHRMPRYPDRIYEIRVVLPDEVAQEFIDLGCAVGANEG